MPKPGALNPPGSVNHTLTAVANAKAYCAGFRINVTTAGVLNATTRRGSTVTIPFPDTGVYIEPGHYTELWGDGTLAADALLLYQE